MYIQTAFAVAMANLYTVIPISLAFGVGILKLYPVLFILSLLAGDNDSSEEGYFHANIPFKLFRTFMCFVCMVTLVGIEMMCVIFEVLYPKHLCNILRMIEEEYKLRRAYNTNANCTLISHGIAHIRFVRRYRKISAIIDILNPATSTLAFVSIYGAGAVLVILNFILIRLASEMPGIISMCIAFAIVIVSVSAFFVFEGWAQVLEQGRSLRRMWGANGGLMLSRKYMKMNERSLRPISFKLGFMGFNFGVLDRSYMMAFLSTTLGYTIAALLEIPTEGRKTF
jgi:hypothetical protein